MTEPIAATGGSAPARGRSARRPLVVGLLALLVLGGAGASIVVTSGDEIRRTVTQAWADWNKPRPPTPEETQAALAKAEEAQGSQPIAAGDPAFWSEVAVFRAGPTRPRPVVVVRRAEWAGPEAQFAQLGSARGPMGRELARQGLIMTLRESTDAVVRDRAAGDPDEPGTPDSVFRLGSALQLKAQLPPNNLMGVRISLVEGTGPTQRVVCNRWLKAVNNQFVNWGAYTVRVAEMIPGEFRTAVSGWGLPPSRAPRVAAQPDALPDGVDARLRSLREADQVAALRALHDDVRARGGSFARWYALSRGYGLLASLTEPVPGPGSGVFAARALLYGQLAATAEHDSPLGLRAQAFAEALCNSTREAKHGLTGAQKADNGRGMTPRDEAIQAFLALNPDALGQLAQRSPDDPLPLYLRALAALRALGRTGAVDEVCRHEVIQAQDDLLAKVPDCFRVIDNLCDAAGVSNLHRATLLGVEAFPRVVTQQVAAVPGLPAKVAEQVRHEEAGADEVALRRALDEAAPGDSNDLSWGALAQVWRDLRFWQVCRRIHFESVPLGTSPRDFADGARPWIADHPNREYVDLFALGADQSHGTRLIRRLDLDGLNTWNWSTVLFIAPAYDQQLNGQLWERIQTQTDSGTVLYVERCLRTTTGGARGNNANFLIQFDPESPAARAALVATDWKTNSKKALDWEREQPWNTPLKAEIGLQLVKAKREDEAKERLEAALSRSPEPWIFAGLAQIYRAQDQTDEYLRAAQVMLQQPDQGLDHATIANALAQYLMKKGQVELAWPWAERGAMSWANWAMDTAWRCAERRRDWTNAEVWVARQSQRYGHEWLNWLAWCLRTGQGHPEAAARMVWAQYDAGRTARDEDEEILLSQYALVTGRPDVTRAIAERHLEANADSMPDLLLLLLATDRVGDRKARDEAYGRIVDSPKASGPKTAKIIGLLGEWDRHRDDQPLADVLKQVDEVLASIPPDRRSNTDAAVGPLLAMYGQADEALPYLKRGDVAECAFGIRLIARHLLAERHEALADDLLLPPGTDSSSKAPEATASEPPAVF